jgi:RNA polymerase sigma-70 factor (ECF subfamily)
MTQPGEAAELSLERFRPYLHLLARMQMEPQFQGKLDLSGVVQQTLWEAHQDRSRFQGQNEAQQAAWLRTILAHNLTDEFRKLGAAVRDVVRERSLEAALENSLSRVEGWLAAEQSSPSQQAMRNEQSLRLAEALAELPEDQRRAVELHHLQGLSLAEVAEQMGRSKGAVASLLFRGLERLRGRLQNESRA